MLMKFFISLIIMVLASVSFVKKGYSQEVKFLPNPIIMRSLDEKLQDFVNAYVTAVNKSDEKAFKALLSKESAACVEAEYVNSKISKNIPSDFLLAFSNSANIPPKTKMLMRTAPTSTLYMRYNNTTEVKYLVKQGDEFKQVTICPEIEKKADEMVMVHEATIGEKQYEMLPKDRLSNTYKPEMIKFVEDFLSARLEDDVSGMLGLMHPSVLKCSKPDVVDKVLLKSLKSKRPKNPDRYWAVFVPGASKKESKYFPTKATHQFAVRYQIEGGWNTEYRHVAKAGNEYKEVTYCILAEKVKK